MVKKRCLLVLVLLCFVPLCFVDAVNLQTNGYVCYDNSSGLYKGYGSSCSGYRRTLYKHFTINNKQIDAYCSQLSNDIYNNSYSRVSNWNTTSKSSLVAGKSIELIRKKYSNKYEIFLYATELVNYIFKYSGSKNFVDNNSTLKGIYNEALTFVNKTVKYSGNDASRLPAIKLESATDNELNSTSVSKTYISNKITLSGLVDNYGSGSGTNNGDTTYKVSATVSAGSGAQVTICNDVAGKSCQSTLTLTKPTNATSNFYVKVTGADAGGDVKVTVAGSNKSSYPSVVRYDSDAASQKLMIQGSATFSRNISTSLNLSIPDSTKHSIKVSKVDEDGNDLTGADLVLYKANKDDDNNTQVGSNLGQNSNGNASFSWSVTKSTDNDDFFNWKYCVKENKSPSGFILKNATICYTPTDRNSTTCLNGDGEEMTDKNYCGASYTCEGEGFTLANNKCHKTTTTAPDVKSCEGKGILNTVTNKCELVVDDPVIPEGGTEATCAEGATLVEGKCYVYADPDLKCSSGTYSEGSCINTSEVDAVCVGGAGAKDSKYCESMDQYMSIVQKGGNLTISKINNKTSVSISKKAATGDDEVPGARLKICASRPNDKGECDAITLTQKGLLCPSYNDEINDESSDVNNCTYDSSTETRTVTLNWISSDVPRVWNGLPVGTYYLVETLPPSGYITVSTATEFTIDGDGTVKKGTQTATDNIVVLRNKLTEISISKDDIATSKEVPGATISICASHTGKDGKLTMNLDEEGECTVAVLADGTSATWTSEDKPHKVVGLPVGTYYLVERVAPKGYSTAESIIFTLKDDGSLVDKDGKSLKDNKIVMHDKKIGEVKTGMLGFYVVSIIILFTFVGGIGSYFFLKKYSS